MIKLGHLTAFMANLTLLFHQFTLTPLPPASPYKHPNPTFVVPISQHGLTRPEPAAYEIFPAPTNHVVIPIAAQDISIKQQSRGASLKGTSNSITTVIVP